MAAVALVTGATGGIGRAVVRALADRGDRVLAVGRDAGRLRDLSDTTPGVETVVLDLREPDRLPATLAGLDRLDALVHCAAISEVAAVAETPHELWRDTFTINVAAAALLVRALLPALRRGPGHVIFINASPGVRAVPRWSAFSGSKAALRELADSLRQEEAPHGVRVTTVYPGGTATERLRAVRAGFGRPYDPAVCVQPESLAALLTAVLDHPADSYLTELTVMPAPR